MHVSWARSFFVLYILGLYFYWRKTVGAKAARKTLVKLTPGGIAIVAQDNNSTAQPTLSLFCPLPITYLKKNLLASKVLRLNNHLTCFTKDQSKSIKMCVNRLIKN
jgi:hypothetical protein